ncbi:MAG: alpha/beta hydrolase [Halioglobus sp.]
MTSAARIFRNYVTVISERIHYREIGDKSLPTLLLLHQSPSSSAMYEELMLALAGSFHILAPDTPGFGASDALPGDMDALSIADYADAMHGFLTALGVKQCHVFGHHTGAGIAVQFEHDYPGTALAMALSGPPLLSESQKHSLPGLASPIEVAADGSHLLQMWQRISAKDPQAPLALLQREVLSAFTCGESYQASYRAITEQPFADQLPGLGCPVMVYAGDCDPLYLSVEPTVALLQHGEMASLPGGERTYVCERQVELIADLLKDFFGRSSPNMLDEKNHGS